MWRLLLTLYFGVLTIFGPSICCCTFRASTKVTSCCNSLQSVNKTISHHQHLAHSSSHCGSCSHKSHTRTIDRPEANSSDHNSGPEKHNCSCSKTRPTLGEVSTTVHIGQREISVFASLFFFVLPDKAVVHLAVERNQAQCNSIFENSRELLRAHCIMRC
jgi:hypothetical protein